MLKWHLFGVKLSSTHSQMSPLSKFSDEYPRPFHMDVPTAPGIKPGLTAYITNNKLIIYQ